MDFFLELNIFSENKELEEKVIFFKEHLKKSIIHYLAKGTKIPWNSNFLVKESCLVVRFPLENYNYNKNLIYFFQVYDEISSFLESIEKEVTLEIVKKEKLDNVNFEFTTSVLKNLIKHNLDLAISTYCECRQ